MSQGVVARAAIVVCGFAALPWLQARLLAHEIGTTRVSVVTLNRSQFAIEVVTDAESLLEKLETVAGEAPSAPADLPVLRDRLEALGSIFQQRVAISFDGQPVQPSLEWSVARSGAIGGGHILTLRLSGDVPSAVGSLSWKYSWTFTPYAFIDRRQADGATTEWLEGGQASAPLSLVVNSPGVPSLQLAGRYVALGFTHILPKGLDHVLFVLGIFLLSRRLRPILLQVTAFTVAHSITLALSIYGLVSLPSSIVEPAIAFSIAYIAVENLVVTDLRPWRYALVFAFGLLHGLGFAGVLREVGLPRTEFLSALLGFNVGVELGQLTVIGSAFLLIGYWFQDRRWYRQRVVLPASASIACLGIYWTLERLRFFA